MKYGRRVEMRLGYEREEREREDDGLREKQIIPHWIATYF